MLKPLSASRWDHATAAHLLNRAGFGGPPADVQNLADLGPEIQNLPATPEEGSTWFPDEGLDLERYIEGVELTLIKRSLERTQGNKVQAARLLNLKRTTLIEKLKRLERGQPGVA